MFVGRICKEYRNGRYYSVVVITDRSTGQQIIRGKVGR